MLKWFVRSKNFDEIVEAHDSGDAFDLLQSRPIDDFGLVVEAQPVNETQAEAIAIRTSMLFARWGRIEEAKQFIAAAVLRGLPDTTDTDIPCDGRMR